MQGITIYDGPSAIDGEPIAAIVTGLIAPARNIKTGPMAQIYIIRSDRHPMEAVNSGADRSVCGDCPLRGRIETNPATGKARNVARSCYVTIMHGPRMVYEAFHRGLYSPLAPEKAATVLRGRKVRVGAYGDPGAVPVTIWNKVLAKVGSLTGYTHQWRRFPDLAAFCMASCDTPDEREAAKALGFRTFRVRGRGEPLMPGEGHCPASGEMGKVVQCTDCLLCSGQRKAARADITILAHGVGAKHFNAAA